MLPSLQAVRQSTAMFKKQGFYSVRFGVKSRERILCIARALAESGLPPERKLEEMVKEAVRWQTANIGFAGIGQIEKRNLPSKLLRSYVAQRDQIEAEYRKVVAEIMSKGDPQTANPEVNTMFVLGMVNSIMQWYKSSGKLSADEIASQAAEFILNALSAAD